MKTWKVLASLTLLVFGYHAANVRGADEPPKAAEPGTLIVIDNAGKEHKLKRWKISVGTRPLSWLAPAAKEAKEKPKEEKEKPQDAADAPKKPAGPEALVVREENSTNFVEGILTFVPLDRIRAIDYDDVKQTVTVRVAVSDKPEEDKQLTGTTKFQGDNKLVIEAEIDKGAFEGAEVKFMGGIPKGIRGVRFPSPKLPGELKKDRPATIVSTDKKDNKPHEMMEIQVLYRTADGDEKPDSTLMFKAKKTFKFDLNQIGKLHFLDSNKEEPECTVTLKEGEENTLTLLKSIPLDDKPADLKGIIGRVAVGYKLFPLHTVAEIRFDEKK